ncbi:MAG: hypothetical protein KJ072_16040 [Verrucomicrobia bacterium]|nr:hypothetical protein [Verrucomicrobiota bacterium]
MERGLTPGTNSVTGGLGQTTRVNSRRLTRHLWAGLLIAVTLGAALWFEWAMFGRVAGLESAWVEASRNPIATGAELRDSVTRMNEALFRFQLTEEATQRDRFHGEARRFSEWLARSRVALRDNPEAARVAEVERAFEGYLAGVGELTERGVRTMRRETPLEVDRTIREKSRELEAVVNRLGELLDAEFSGFVTEARGELRALRGALMGSGVAMIAFLGVAGFQIYRGIMAPMRAELSEAHAAFVRQEQLASLGVLAAGVAHEIRNPLTALKFRLFSLRKALPAALAEHPDLGILGKEINRLERIVQDFLEFARPAEPHCARVAAAALVEEVHELLRSDLDRRGIEVRLEADPAIEVSVDRPQLKQVLINLVRNAAESMGQGGTLTLGVREGAASWLRRAQAMVLLEVADTGKGIPAEVEPRIFDPFFSTKEGGSGLGLSIAARIAELHGGHIQYATRPGRGTTFTVVLPKPTSHERENPADRG